VYQIVCLPEQRTVTLVSCSHPVTLAGEGSMLHFVQTAGEFSFLVPKGTQKFAVRVSGEGDKELVKAAVFNAAGQAVWQEDGIGASQSYRYDGPPIARDELWKVRLSRPTKAVFEDHFLELRGIATLMSFQPTALLRP
jgi:hypothetical protein